eukprot:2050159-Pyramimonas_sp.AAC.1
MQQMLSRGDGSDARNKRKWKHEPDYTRARQWDEVFLDFLEGLWVPSIGDLSFFSTPKSWLFVKHAYEWIGLAVPDRVKSEIKPRLPSSGLNSQMDVIKRRKVDLPLVSWDAPPEPSPSSPSPLALS